MKEPTVNEAELTASDKAVLQRALEYYEEYHRYVKRSGHGVKKQLAHIRQVLDLDVERID